MKFTLILIFILPFVCDAKALDSSALLVDSLIVRPVNDSTELIIKKAIIYKGKTPSIKQIDTTTAKVWLLKLYFL